MQYSIAGCVFSINCWEANVGVLIRTLLRNHISKKKPGLLVDIRAESGSVAKAITLPSSARQVVWVWPEEAHSWPAESLFYRLLFPHLCQLLASLHTVRLHAALVHQASIGGVLVFGDRGAGKSTFAASWLECGGQVATDDTVFVRQSGESLHFYGLQRDFHLDPELFPRLPRLPGLRNTEEYMPGQGRNSYDWVANFPAQRLEAIESINHVLFSSVSNRELTRIEQIPHGQYVEALEQEFLAWEDNLSVPKILLQTVTDKLIQARGWRATWGMDVFALDKKHLGLLSSRLNLQ